MAMIRKEIKNWHGFDTETINGYARVIATEEEWSEVNSFYDICNFFFKFRHHSTIFWTWNLRYDMQAIFKWLGEEKFKELLENGFQGINFEGINIRYVQGILAQFEYANEKTHYFFDMAKFYGVSPLEKEVKKHLGRTKQDFGHWVEVCKQEQEGLITHKQLEKYFCNKTWDIGKYCQDDAYLTLELAKIMKKGYNDAGFSFRNCYSQAGIAQDYMLRQEFQYPKRMRYVPAGFDDIAQASYHGGIFDTPFRGAYDAEVHNYDINSAYPYAQANLPNWMNGHFKAVDKPTGQKYGWYICEIDYPYVPYQLEHTQYYEIFCNDTHGKIPLTNNLVIYPVGKRVEVITALEYDFMQKNNIFCKFKIGFEWFPSKEKKYRDPFVWMEKAYKERQKIKKEDPEDMRQMALKIMLNSAYGKTAQFKKGYGKMTNFFYASYITASCRIQLQEAIIDARKKGLDILNLATDGIYVSGELDLPVSEKLGDWEHSVYEKGLFLGSGIYQLWKDDGSFETHARGVTNRRDFNIKEEMENNKDNDCLYYYRWKPIQAGEVFNFPNIFCFEDLNKFKKVGRKLNVNTDKKHQWPREYKNFEDFLENPQFGKPLDITDKQRTLAEFGIN